MSVEYEAIAMYGIRVNDSEDALAFVHGNGHTQIEELYDEGVDEDLEGITLVCLNPFTGRNYILGYPLRLGEPLDAVQGKWARLFPNSQRKAAAILEVKLY